MSNEAALHPVTETSHDVHLDEHGMHHHHETFITKYVFSQDHKMICKQFLITGMIWAIIGGLMSVLVPAAAGLSGRAFSDPGGHPGQQMGERRPDPA